MPDRAPCRKSLIGVQFPQGCEQGATHDAQLARPHTAASHLFRLTVCEGVSPNWAA